MKRSSLTYIGILGLCQVFAPAALATGDPPICYSTGPIENVQHTINTGLGNFFANGYEVKVLNNATSGSVNARVLALQLNGSKINIFDSSVSVGSQASALTLADVTEKFEFEVQVKLTGRANTKTLLGGFGKDPNGTLVDAQRLVHSEWVTIPCSTFGPVAP